MRKEESSDVILMAPRPYEYQHIYTHQIEKLKARLLNLADSMTTDVRQANSIKGLIKDFCNLAHLEGREDLDNWAIEMKVIEEGDTVPVSNLRDDNI